MHSRTHRVEFRVISQQTNHVDEHKIGPFCSQKPNLHSHRLFGNEPIYECSDLVGTSAAQNQQLRLIEAQVPLPIKTLNHLCKGFSELYFDHVFMTRKLKMLNIHSHKHLNLRSCLCSKYNQSCDTYTIQIPERMSKSLYHVVFMISIP